MNLRYTHPRYFVSNIFQGLDRPVTVRFEQFQPKSIAQGEQNSAGQRVVY